MPDAKEYRKVSQHFEIKFASILSYHKNWLEITPRKTFITKMKQNNKNWNKSYEISNNSIAASCKFIPIFVKIKFILYKGHENLKKKHFLNLKIVLCFWLTKNKFKYLIKIQLFFIFKLKKRKLLKKFIQKLKDIL